MRLLPAIAPEPLFFPVRQAVEAAIRAKAGLDVNAGRRLMPSQQAFAAETGGMSAETTQSLACFGVVEDWHNPARLHPASKYRSPMP